jgi:thymidylate synthase (FAD)
MSAEVSVLDHGYLRLIEAWGSDERVVEAARMSTAKGFLGWGPKEDGSPGDEKLLKYLWDHGHATPFEMAGMIVEVKAPIMVFREWHRHRTQSFNEMSARYIPLPDENYVPSAERLMMASATNKQAGVAAGAKYPLTDETARMFQRQLAKQYKAAEELYQQALEASVPKELARLILPMGRYSAMRASANLRNWLGFLKLRCDSAAQWEIRQYANALASMVKERFPRTYEVAQASLCLP